MPDNAQHGMKGESVDWGIQELVGRIEAYKKVICDTGQALDAAETELDELLAGIYGQAE